jgi:ApaG protein
MYREVTQGCQVDVEPAYLPEQSNPREGLHVYGYKIRITNLGQRPLRLMSRHWVITDGNGKVQEVRGPGVVGEQPVLEVGETFEYSSYCPLETPSGNMRGSYQMVTESGERFEAKIPLFFLRDIRNLH